MNSFTFLYFARSITPDLLQHRDELSKFIGDEISRTMTEQKSLEKRYEELIEERANMKGYNDTEMDNQTILKYDDIDRIYVYVNRPMQSNAKEEMKIQNENLEISNLCVLVSINETML